MAQTFHFVCLSATSSAFHKTVALGVLIFLLCLPGSTFAVDPALLASLQEQPGADDTRIAMPSGEIQKEKRLHIADIFDLEDGDTRDNKVSLAKKLLQTGTESGSDPAAQFVLYEMARDLASQAGDVDVAIDAVDTMDKKFKTDGNKLRAQSIVAAAKSRAPPADRKRAIRRGIDLIDSMIGSEQYAEVGRFVMVLSPLTSRLRDRELVSQLKTRHERGQMLYNAHKTAQNALAKLKQNPDDADSATVLGKYLAFVKGDWQRGLVLLAAGSDEELQSLAKHEIALPNEVTQQIELGEGWLRVSESSGDLFSETQKARAGLWYRNVLKKLSGLNKLTIKKRIDELADIDAPAGEFYRAIDQESNVDKSINLFDILDLKQNAIYGKWSFTNRQGEQRALTMVHPSGLARLQIPIQPPEQYTLELEVTRTSGHTDFFIGIIYKGVPCGIVFDGWGGNRCGLTAASENRNVVYARSEVPGITIGKRASIVCSVRSNWLQVDRNGKTIIRYEGKPKWDSTNRGWRVPRSDQLMLGANRSEFIIHSLKLTPIAN